MNAEIRQATVMKKPTWLLGVFVCTALAITLLMFWTRPFLKGLSSMEPASTEGVSTGGSTQAHDSKPLHALSDEQLQRMVTQASVAIDKNPRDVTAWAMLAHTEDMLGKFAESSKAYAKLSALMPDNAQILADYADALAVAHGRVLDGEPLALLHKALTIDPNNAKALALAGTAAMESRHYDEALGYWQRARAVSPDATFGRQIDSSIAAAKAASQIGSVVSERSVSGRSAVSPSLARDGAVVAGHLSLADDLLAKVSPDAMVFIFARPVSGSRMPVALLRKHVRDLPLDFRLDDSMSMVPDLKLSQLDTVVIGARVSPRGDVMPQPGDMQGWSAPVSVGSKGIKLEISEVLK